MRKNSPTNNLPDVSCVKYFSDGCAAQFKNFKKFTNLCHHSKNFDLNVEWIFFVKNIYSTFKSKSLLK